MNGHDDDCLDVFSTHLSKRLNDVDDASYCEMKSDDCYPSRWHCHRPYHYHCHSDQGVWILFCLESRDMKKMHG